MNPACDATQKIRIKHRRRAIQAETDAKEHAGILEKEYVAERFENGDSRKELLARRRYRLFKSGEKWTERRQQKSKIFFENCPDIKRLTL
jgi:hypothetical protein